MGNCSAAAYFQKRWVRDVTFIRKRRAMGFDWRLIVADLGTTEAALRRRLYRRGERRLAAELYASSASLQDDQREAYRRRRDRQNREAA